MPDRDPLGLEMEQEYHTVILEWLQERKVRPLVANDSEEVLLLDQADDDVTEEFKSHFTDEFDCFTIELGKVSIYTSDYNYYRGDTVVYWTGESWGFCPGQD